MVDTTIRNPDNAAHFARIKPIGRRVTIERNGRLVADTRDALWLQETGRDVYDPVVYLPRADVGAPVQQVDGKSTHCPLKGDASYLSADGDEIAWTYDRPLPGSAVLEGLVAFDPNLVVITIIGPRA